jgi:adenylyltransferase/sulfurtransferase
MQATAVLKLITGLGAPLVGKLLSYDALDQSTHMVRLRRDPNCVSCGDESRPPALREEAEYC